MGANVTAYKSLIRLFWPKKPRWSGTHSFVAFVDLVKAYNMINHNLPLKVLEKYRAPPKFVAATKPCTPTSRLS